MCTSETGTPATTTAEWQWCAFWLTILLHNYLNSKVIFTNKPSKCARGKWSVEISVQVCQRRAFQLLPELNDRLICHNYQEAFEMFNVLVIGQNYQDSDQLTSIIETMAIKEVFKRNPFWPWQRLNDSYIKTITSKFVYIFEVTIHNHSIRYEQKARIENPEITKLPNFLANVAQHLMIYRI